MLSVNFFRVVLSINSLLSLCVLTSNILWLVESQSKSDGLSAFRKLLEKSTNETGIHKVTLQASLFGEKKMLTSTLPIETQATPALPGMPSELPEVLQNIVVISDRKLESTSKMEQKLSSDVSTLNEQEASLEIVNLTNNQNVPLENVSAVKEDSSAAVNETGNATLSSTEVDQASGESEVMPSFDEWKRRMLAEQSTKGDNIAQPPSLPLKKVIGQKRRRNYASYECGAKVVAANGEAESTGRILNEQMDEYMLNPCNAHIWFVIELCETIQVTQIELANFELFSSTPKDVTIYWSDRFPTREWTSLGGFVAQDHRTLQSFTLQQQGYGKFMKIEMLSHYGTEHYCPLSVIRVFGTSMVDEYEEMETVHHPSEDEEDRLDIPSYDGKDSSSKDLFGSAKEVVYNMVRKAAQALTRENEGAPGNTTDAPVTVSTTDSGDAYVTISSRERLHQHLLSCGMCCSSNRTPFPTNSYCGFMQSLLGSKNLQRHCELHICQCLPDHHRPFEREHVESKNATVAPTNATEVVADQTYLNATTTQESHCTATTEPAASLLLVNPIAQTTHPTLQPSVEETADTPATIDVLQDAIHPSPSVGNVQDESLRNDTWGEAESKHLGNGVTQGQKESVFVRLNNRIRGLEANLSLSTQYLQELSQRYRRQMEDMQRVFNRTVGALNETAHRAAEKDARQQETIQELQEKVDSLTRSSDIMMGERHAIYRQVYEAHLFLIVTEVIVMVTVLSLCLRRFTLTATPPRRTVPAPLYSSPLKRHNSISHVHSTPVGEKKRRPSGEVSSAGSYAHLMIVEPTVPIFLEPPPPKGKKKHRNKKPRHLQRSISNPNLATFSSSHPNIENIPRSLFGGRPVTQPFQNLTNGILELVKLPKDNCLLNK